MEAQKRISTQKYLILSIESTSDVEKEVSKVLKKK